MYFRFSDNTTPAPTDQTFSDLAEIRLRKRCFTIKKSTYSGYAYCIKTYILPYLNICTEPRNVQKKFKTILKHCEMPDCNFLALRHGTRKPEYSSDDL